MGLEDLKLKSLSQSEVVNDTVESLEKSSTDIEVDETARNELETKSGYETNENLEFSYKSLECPEFLTDREMVEGIADSIESMEKFSFAKWQKLSLNGRVDVLNRVEQQIANIEHRPALKVEMELMEPRHLGYQSASEHKIVLNSWYVGSNNPNTYREVVDTIVHEGRHAYQHYNVDVKMIHESPSEVKTWEENFYDPKYQYYHATGQKIMIPYDDGTLHDVDYRLYYYQPVEIDARNFAADVLDKLKKDGFLS